MEKTKIRISFKGTNQLPCLMIMKEYYKDHKIVHADIIYMEDEYESDIVIDGDPILVNERRVELK